jgi:predicted transcriptional regulator
MKLDNWPAVTIRLKPELAEQIKRLAEEEGLPPTTL